MTTEKNRPEHFDCRILLVVAGHSPAIITETLYALPANQKPTEIRIITTASGKDILKKQLLGANNIVQQLCKEHGIPVPLFDESRIYVIATKDDVELQDIQTEAENEITADFITVKVRELTKEPDCSIHVSIAGGRKTMTYYLGYALSVFGRIQDRMSHVLVEDRYAIQGFFYPTKESTYLTNSRTNETFDAKDVKVMLGELPFIRLRDGLTEDLLNGKDKDGKDISYSKIIEIAQRQLAPISLRVVYGAVPQLHCGGKEVKLPPAQLALYVWMLQRHKAGKPAIRFTDKATKAELAEEFKIVYAELSKESGHYANAEESVKSMDTDYFGAPRTNINKKLAEILGKPKAKAYLLQSSGTKNAIQYSLSNDLKPEYISFEYSEKELKKPVF